MKPIEIYGKENCRWCKDAKGLCTDLGLPFYYVDVEKDSIAKSEMYERNPKATTLPQIFIGDVLIGGYVDLEATPVFKLQQMMAD